jgi:hypothetical protein
MQISHAHAALMQLLVHNTHGGAACPRSVSIEPTGSGTPILVSGRLPSRLFTFCRGANLPSMSDGKKYDSLRIDSQRQNEGPSYRISTVAQQLLPIMQVAAAVVCLVCC